MTYVIDTFSIYYEKKSEDKNLGEQDNIESKETSELLSTFKNYSFKAGILTILIGFVIYLSEKYTEYGSQFNIFTFIFGKTKCKGLN